MRLSILLTVIIFVLGFTVFALYVNLKKQPMVSKNIEPAAEGEMTYIPIGDSYTIGNGVVESNRWPNVLTKHLNEAGINVRLIANPAVSGYRVEDALKAELPVIKKLRPDFVTVLIGANDNFGRKAAALYKRELIGFLDELQSILKNKENIVLITIPDYSKSPAAIGNNTKGIPESIEEYNQIIKDEAQKRNLKVADIFPVSQTMTEEKDYIYDGLHPSALGYAKWEKVIYPVVLELLQ